MTHAFEPAAPAIRGERSVAVARAFGVTIDAVGARRRTACPVAPPGPGRILFLTGPSGSGKSSVLRAVLRKARRRAVATVRPSRTPLPEKPLVDLFADADLGITLRRLARVGLAELWTWLRPPSQLSEGQRWRLRLALVLADVERTRRPTLIVCDEFAALLDRVSAKVVATVLRRAIAADGPASAVVATSHDDLHAALAADVTVECDFGSIRVGPRMNADERR